MSFFPPPPRPCQCGSGEFAEDRYDGHGIYLMKCCDRCIKHRLKGFRADIMDAYECDEDIEGDPGVIPDGWDDID